MRDDRALILSVKRGPTQTYAELQAKILPDISISTVQRRLREVGIKKWIAAERSSWMTSKQLQDLSEHGSIKAGRWKSGKLVFGVMNVV